MQAGSMDRRIRIEYKVVTPDPTFGTETIIWALLATVWAKVEDVLPSRSEAVRTGLVLATRQTKVNIRYMPGLDSSMRLIISRPLPEIYQIVGGPATIGRNRELEMVVEKYSS